MIRLRLPGVKLRQWFEREVTSPLDAMYKRIDDHAIQDDRGEMPPRLSVTTKPSPT